MAATAIKPQTITDASRALLKDLWNDAPNWSGIPPIDIKPQLRGNLTQLKRAGLLTTYVDEGTWVYFTDEGVEFCKAAFGGEDERV